MSTQLERLQRASNVFTYLFDRVSLRKNTWKMVSMTCHIFHIPGIMLVVAYEIQATGMVPIYQEWQGMQVQCPDFGVEVAAGLLLTHRQSQYGMVRG